MPKIDVNEQLFFSLLGREYSYSPEFEHLLSSAKAELDEAPSDDTPKSERTIKIELNDCISAARRTKNVTEPFYPRSRRRKHRRTAA